ncbi:MAG: bifunctional phosphoribosyl-AMP cyclohydrolase/phosphoribosyl-ATP diphosphatase HisIE [Chitinophagales bacterium]
MTPDFSKHPNGLLPVIVQDAVTQKVLTLGFMNDKSFAQTQVEGKVIFFNNDKEMELSQGQRSGNLLEVKEILLDCDSDTLLIKAEPSGPVCHTGADTCFNEPNHRFVLKTLEQVIAEHKQNPAEASYTSSLFEKGVNQIAQRLGEEAVELVIESTGDNDKKFLEEGADLLYHFLVLLHAKNYSLHNVIMILSERQQ